MSVLSSSSLSFKFCLPCWYGFGKARSCTRCHYLSWLGFYSYLLFLTPTTSQSVPGIFYMPPSSVPFICYWQGCLLCITDTCAFYMSSVWVFHTRHPHECFSHVISTGHSYNFTYFDVSAEVQQIAKRLSHLSYFP